MKLFVQQGDNLVLYLWGIALYIHFMSALAFKGVAHSKGWRGSKPRGLAHRRFTAPPDDGEAVGICFDGGCSLEHGEVKLEPKSLDDDDSSVQVPPADFDKDAQLHVSERLEGWTGPTVWSEFQGLAAETGGTNLGQGYPNWDPPAFVVEAAQQAVADGFHQYTRTSGHPRLVQHLADRYSRHLGREVDPVNEVAVTVGASQALYATMQAVLRPGDEVVLLEPYFDLYIGQIRLCGATPVSVPLEPRGGQWVLDPGRLRAAMTPRTRALVINTPHNPTGKVFTRAELEDVAAAVAAHPRCLVVSDEVYKYIVHAESESGADRREEGPRPAGHVHFATLPGMWDRTITLSSAGKTFSVTGWSIGWVVGPAHFVREVQTLLPYMQFCAATPMQEALVHVLQRADRPYRGHESYYHWMRHVYSEKKALMDQCLKEVGIDTIPGQGGFFMIGDISGVRVPERYLAQGTPAMPEMTRDWAFCRYLALEHGVVAIPTSGFYSKGNRHMGANFVRFAFCKKDETILEARDKMKGLGAKPILSIRSGTTDGIQYQKDVETSLLIDEVATTDAPVVPYNITTVAK
eukprot:CAMPEP_0194719326 /NCGR_PEP_ID=MMETSP0296-20130528/10796_1 /TAXON_ID=39354 /ORGANISM="Heterosigma akashiwo, Strain CCMP2393" /LENGTH=575 /DNA_ID=CAMNT_0039621023 /DNA_START=11 /DNA_END=1741 /DNA_ORIENTATION=+